MSTSPDDPEHLPGSSAAWTVGSGELTDVERPASRYAPGGELGRGGMGVVRAATDAWLDRDVAIKRPHADLSSEGLDRMMREARITARLVHPAIPPVHDVGEDAQGPYYTMPVLLGTTLREHLTGGSTPVRTLVHAVAAASRAAGYAHTRGVVHRDIKPANVLLGDHGEVWLLDWGVAFDPAVPDTAVVGTPDFQAPEQRTGGRATPATDVYALGATLRLVLDATPEPHPELRAVVDRCLRADPRERYPDGSALADELARWLDGHRVIAHAYSAREVLLRAAVRYRAPLAVAAAATVIVAVLSVVAAYNQSVERARAAQSLSTSLSQQAAALRGRDARPEAEVLAAHSLLLQDNPLARGVLMAWHGTPRAALTRVTAPPCRFLQDDGYAVCAGDTVAVYDPDGNALWSAPLALPESPGRWVGEVVAARRYDDAVVLQRSSSHVELWRDGVRRRVRAEDLGYLGLADGPLPVVFDTRRIGRLDLESGEIAWGDPTCDHIETAVTSAAGDLIVGCRDRSAWVGTLDAPATPIALPGSPSALAWADGPVIGTFEGQVLVRHGDAWHATATGVGAPRQLLPLPGGRVAIVGERGRIRLWSTTTRAFLGTLPHGGTRAAAVGEALLVLATDLRRYAIDADLQPVTFDHADEGGLSFLAVSPSGARLLAGSASGDVTTWGVRTGEPRRLVGRGPATAKGGAFDGEHAVVYAFPSTGLMRMDLGTGSAERVADFSRVTRPWAGGFALLRWDDHVLLTGPSPGALPVPMRPVAVASAETLWVGDERGDVYALEDGALKRRFTLPSPTGHLARSGDLLLSLDGAAIEARTRAGAMVWRWENTAPLTALDATDAWVAAGDLEGRLVVLRPDGALVARIVGHTRRVSEVVVHDAVVYTASWDGTVRRWGLGAADVDPAALLDEVTAAWGLTLDEALRGADPL